MEMQYEKVLDCESKTLMDLKRKRTAEGEPHFTGIKQTQSRQCTALDNFQRLIKNGKPNPSVNKCGPSARAVREPLIHSYSNFMTSQVPQRMAYYQDGQWCDSPQDFTNLIKKDFQLKRAATQIEFNGRQLFIDFVHMSQLDLKTGLQQSIGWVDESGQCFFPDTLVDNNLESPPNHDISLELEIEINGMDRTKVQVSNAMLDPHRVNEQPAINNIDVEVEVSCNKSTHKVRSLSECIDSRNADPDIDTVKNTFVKGMCNSNTVEIVEIYRGSSASMEARLELFHKQVEITKKNRGDANVCYAWLPSTLEMLSSTMMYGVGDIRMLRTKSRFGDGVHLIPLSHTIYSAKASPVDKSGVRHMIFCRVIMGSMEVLRLDSKQFHPSCEQYDNGVDNLESPRIYMIWNMNKNTHIFPEYVVSFKVQSDTKGVLVANQLQMDAAPGCGKGPQERDPNCIPPLNSFGLLLAAMSNKLPPSTMGLVRADYDLFLKMRMSRIDFIRKLRTVVGDSILMSSIQSIRPKVEPK